MAHIKTADNGFSFDDVTANKAQNVTDIAIHLRMLLADVMPGITEVNWKAQQIAGYGVGEKKMSEHFCYIAPLKAHVNLGFMYGADLNDADGLMEGSGKALRHIKVKSMEDATNPAIRELLVQASKHLPKLK